MRIDELHSIHKARPFCPFTIRVADGREYHVVHPEFLAYAPPARTISVVTPKGFHDIIDLMMITSIHLDNGKPRRKRKGKTKG